MSTVSPKIMLGVISLAAVIGFFPTASLSETTDGNSRLGDVIERRFDRTADRVERQYDRRSERADARGHEVLSRKLDRKGDRAERHLENRGRRIDNRLDRRSR